MDAQQAIALNSRDVTGYVHLAKALLYEVDDDGDGDSSGRSRKACVDGLRIEPGNRELLEISEKLSLNKEYLPGK